jgi:hypothetical protein
VNATFRGDTVVLAATESGSMDTLTAVLGAPGLVPDTLNGSGHISTSELYIAVPVVAAAFRGDAVTLGKLLDAGASLRSCGGDAIVASVRGRSLACFNALVTAGVDPAASETLGVMESALHPISNVRTLADLEVRVQISTVCVCV